MDGAVGITQNPIQPGGNTTYEFEIENNQAGTFWYVEASVIFPGTDLV